MLRAKRQGNKKGTRAYLRKLGCVGFWLAGAADVVEEEAAGEAVLSARVDPEVGSGVILGGRRRGSRLAGGVCLYCAVAVAAACLPACLPLTLLPAIYVLW